MSKYSFKSWFPKWQGFHLITFQGAFATIYKYAILFGFWEVRRWR